MYSLALNIKAEQIPWCEWIYFNLWIMQTENYKHDAKQAFSQFYTYIVFLNKIVEYKHIIHLLNYILYSIVPRAMLRS